MPPSKIRKRNDEVVDFDRSRIEQAIESACVACGEPDRSFIPVVTDFIIKDIEHVYGEIFTNRIPSVEDVQDIVERNLMKFNKFEVAKTYIIYRAEKQEEREEEKEKLIRKFEKNGFKVTKSDGRKEDFDPAKIEKMFVHAVRWYEDKCQFDDLMNAFKKNIVKDMKTSDIAKLLVKACVDLVTIENIGWSHIAGRLALFDLYKKAGKNRGLTQKDIYSAKSFTVFFEQYVAEKLYYEDFLKYYSKADLMKAGEYLAKHGKARDMEYGYTTILSLSKRYLNNPNKFVRELPQEMYMSVALFLAIPEKDEDRLAFAFRVYDQCSLQHISLPTPTLINARTNFYQLTSCFQLNIGDDLRAIYHGIENMAQISKYGGGIGSYWWHIRSRGSSIRGIHNASAGVIPWLKVVNDTATAVNQLGARLGAISVTLDIWHRDIYDFLDMQTETGDIRAKVFDIFPSVSIPDLFMQRVEEDGDWTLMDPHEVMTVYGRRIEDSFEHDFEIFYTDAEKNEKLKLNKVVKAKDLFKTFLKSTVETGMPYVFFRDTVNRLNPNKHSGNIYSTQLCTEICQNSSPTEFIEETLEDNKVSITYKAGDTVTCNIASINVAKVYTKEAMAETVPVIMRILDNVVTITKYPLREAEQTSLRYRPVALWYLGLAEYLATHSLAYDSAEAREVADKMFEEFAWHVYRASIDLARERGKYELYNGSEYDQWILLGHDETWFATKTTMKEKWREIFRDMKTHGVRFGYHFWPAPNTSTAGIVGTTAALLPIYKKYFVETNLSSPTIRIAPQLNNENFWYYKEYVSMDMNDVIDMVSTIYKWIDQSISFEWMIDPAKVSPRELFSYYMKAWKQGVKTVYYVRSLSNEVNQDGCVSCSG